MAKERGFFMVSYDLSDNKRRTKIAHLLEGYGERVQYSVFEVWATAAEIEKLRKRLKPYVKEEGSVRIYQLCAACQTTREVLGQGTPTEVPELQIV
ncbi:MAG: CRISPR-associated endonuclease Cas2 [Anaerolineales bacterium]|nr:CRISPR-associated endonuclease Cas2 [Anaerolineales bacterium]